MNTQRWPIWELIQFQFIWHKTNKYKTSFHLIYMLKLQLKTQYFKEKPEMPRMAQESPKKRLFPLGSLNI